MPPLGTTWVILGTRPSGWGHVELPRPGLGPGHHQFLQLHVLVPHSWAFLPSWLTVDGRRAGVSGRRGCSRGRELSPPGLGPRWCPVLGRPTGRGPSHTLSATPLPASHPGLHGVLPAPLPSPRHRACSHGAGSPRLCAYVKHWGLLLRLNSVIRTLYRQNSLAPLT